MPRLYHRASSPVKPITMLYSQEFLSISGNCPNPAAHGTPPHDNRAFRGALPVPQRKRMWQGRLAPAARPGRPATPTSAPRHQIGSRAAKASSLMPWQQNGGRAVSMKPPLPNACGGIIDAALPYHCRGNTSRQRKQCELGNPKASGCKASQVRLLDRYPQGTGLGGDTVFACKAGRDDLPTQCS